MRVADGIERVNERFINFFLVEEAGQVVVVDSGMPGNWGLLLSKLVKQFSCLKARRQEGESTGTASSDI